MDNFSKKGFHISLFLHAFILVVLVVTFSLSHYSSKQKSQHIFQLEQAPKNKSVSIAPVKSTPSVAASTSSSVTKTSLPPKVSTPSPSSLSKLNTASKTPGKLTQPKMSYEEFVKTQAKPMLKETKAVTAQSIPTPKIKVSDIKTNFEQKLSSAQALNTGTSSSAIVDYQAHLRSAIDFAWKQPEDFSGYTNGALFEFDVDKFGHIRNVRIIQTSGSRIFDESVQQAFTRAGSVKPTPDGRTFSGCRLTFTKKSKVL